MSHGVADFLEQVHHFLYGLLRGFVHENQYVGTVKMGEEELEKTLFHPTDARYNWLAYWKTHRDDGRDSEGSWKLRHPRHAEYVDRGMQVHMTLFPSTENPDWLDVYAHHEYDNVLHPIKHLKEHKFSPKEGKERAQRYFSDNGVDLYHLH